MSLQIKNWTGTVKIDNVTLPLPCPGPQAVDWPQLLETASDDASVEICSGASLAATVKGPKSSTTVNYPPTDSMATVYYNRSYRWRLRAPGGSIGIRA